MIQDTWLLVNHTLQLTVRPISVETAVAMLMAVVNDSRIVLAKHEFEFH